MCAGDVTAASYKNVTEIDDSRASRFHLRNLRSTIIFEKKQGGLTSCPGNVRDDI